MGCDLATRFGMLSETVSSLYQMREGVDPRIVPLMSKVWATFLVPQREDAEPGGLPFMEARSLLRVSFSDHLKEDESDRNERELMRLHPTLRWNIDQLHKAQFLGGEQEATWRALQLVERGLRMIAYYDDTFRSDCRELAALLATIRGELFEITKAYEYRAAWMMRIIVGRCFSLEEDDLLSRIGRVLAWQHQFVQRDITREQVTRIWGHFLVYQFNSQEPVGLRLDTILTLINAEGVNVYSHPTILRMVDEWNVEQEELALGNPGYKPALVDLSRVEYILQARKENSPLRRYPVYCHFSGLQEPERD